MSDVKNVVAAVVARRIAAKVVDYALGVVSVETWPSPWHTKAHRVDGPLFIASESSVCSFESRHSVGPYVVFVRGWSGDVWSVLVALAAKERT